MSKHLMALLGATAAVTLAASGVSAADSQQGADQWRASKLIGVPIYGPQSKTVGKISDVLVDKDGKVAAVVIGVGGFLGLGEKDVAIPYAQVKFSEQPLAPQNPEPAPANNMAAGSGVATTPALGTEATVGGTTAAIRSDTPPRATSLPATSRAYPDHGMIDMTEDQLKSAPSFHFAS